MDLEKTFDALLSTNEELREENGHLRSLLSLFEEHTDLTARIQSVKNNAHEEFTGRKPSSLWQSTTDEGQFKKDLEQIKHEHRTSSPVDFKSLIQSSMHTETSEKEEPQNCQADVPLEVKHRLLGEIAYQLDGRILSHVFQGHKRLYGFTVLNIPDKIIEVSTHPLTGQVDEGYRLHLTQRYAHVMEQLKRLGYKTALHPPFTEFIVNTYGILKERPTDNSPQAIDYNSPDFLMNIIVTTAPGKLQKDLLLVLTCLCSLAKKDGKPLVLWK